MLKTGLQRTVPRLQLFFLVSADSLPTSPLTLATQNLFLKPPIHGAYTELFAGLSLDVNAAHNGAFSEFPHTLTEADQLTFFLSHSMGPFGPPASERSRAGAKY